MEENKLVHNPKLYLIESGECRLEKKYDLEIRNPLNPKEVLSREAHWLTICTVGPGTLLGEEVLEYKRNEECYDYRVTVYSIRTLIELNLICLKGSVC